MHKVEVEEIEMDHIKRFKAEKDDQEPYKVKKFLFKSGDDLRQDNLVL
jgi:phosphatidylinositol kinase/protein kinase (PI-3  family)